MENTALPQELKKVGMSDKEARIYAAVLELGSAFPSKIAQATKLNRTTVYAVLSNLAIKGLITEIEKNKKICYQIERPHKLVNYARSRIQMAEDGYEQAKKLLPDIEGLFSLTPNKPKVRFFEGVEGVKSVFSDHIAQKNKYEMLAYSNVEDLMSFIPVQFQQSYIKVKERLGITTRAIFPDNKYSASYNKQVYRGRKKEIFIDMKLIPPEMFPYKGDITIYGDNKVSIVNFHKQNLIGVIIEDKTIADMMKMIFELAWAGADIFGKHQK